MPSSVLCPHCGRVLLALSLDAPPAVPSPASLDAPLLLRIPEAARLLGVSRSTMYQLVGSGEVPVVRLGRAVRIARSELERRIRL